MKRGVFAVSVPIAWLVVFSGPVLANNFVVGHGNNINVTLNSADSWIVIRSATVIIPADDAARHGCVATASADMKQAGAVGVENQYRFVLTRNNTDPATDSGSERTLELVDNDGVNDPNSKPVSTTQNFTGLTNNNGVDGTGTHTFYFLGRKVQAVDANADVLDASLSVICVDIS
jgi:hypothetical protein